MDKVKKSPEKIYRHSKTSRRFLLLFAASSLSMFCGFGIFLARVIIGATFSGQIIWGGYTIIMMYVAFAGFWASKESALNQKFIVTDIGIWHFYYGKRFYPWDALIELELVQSFLFSTWVIHTNRATIEQPDIAHKWLLWGSWGYAKSFIPIPAMHRSIRNIEKFKETEFGQDLYHYAPHLFEGYEEKSTKRGFDKNRAIMEESSIEQEAFFHEQAQKKAEK